MKLVTFASGAATRAGLLDEHRGVLDVAQSDPSLPSTVLQLIEGGAKTLERLAKLSATPDAHAWVPLSHVQLCAPIPHPRKNIFCVGRNYRAHGQEMAHAAGRQAAEFTEVPVFFTKPATTVVGPDAPVERHRRYTDKLDYEVELAVVIGLRVRNVSKENALQAVFGYTIINDVTARDAQRAHQQFFKGKSFDTFCPMGPSIVTADEFGQPKGHSIRLTVNGEIRQDGNTSDLIFGVPELIESLSAALTLEPGDIIATGTPAGVAAGMKPPKWLDVGDVVECQIESIGTLTNTIVE